MQTEVIDVTALLRSESAGAAVKQALSGERFVTLHMRAASQVDLATLKSLRADVLFLEIDASSTAEMRTLADYVGDKKSAPVVLTAQHLDVMNMRDLMQIGILDVVPQPIEHDAILVALERAVKRRKYATTTNDNGCRGLVVSFLQSGGGVGTTSLAVQGACALGRAKNSPDISLFDLDIQFGTAAFLVDAKQDSSIVELAHNPERLDGVLLRSAMTHPHNRFHLLAAPAVLNPMGLEANAVIAAIDTSRREFDVTLVDLPLFWTQWTHAVLLESDAVALVTVLTVPALRQARKQLAMLEREKMADRVVVIANRVEGGLFGNKGVSLKDAAKALGRKVDIVVPTSEAMQSAADQGVPLSEVSGGRSLEGKLATMMNEILGRARSAYRK